MSTSNPSASEVSFAEFMQMKKQMVEMTHMMQPLVVEGNPKSSGPTLQGFMP